ncbi:hypothetical protein ACFRLW_27515 [Streptomyces sp. NPDC056728]
MPLPLHRRTAVLSLALILSLAGCGRDTSGSGKASPTPASPIPASPSAGLPEGESRRSAYVSESDDAEIMDVAATCATDGWAIGRDRAHVSTATEKAGGTRPSSSTTTESRGRNTRPPPSCRSSPLSA